MTLCIPDNDYFCNLHVGLAGTDSMKELDLKLGTQQGGAVNEELQCKNERLEAIESSPSININFPNFAVHDPEIIHKSAAVP